ncbi:MAG: hypothetical protein GY940_42725 [bacterium]|nr:hypothetical protein [bacterium]
MKRIIYIFLFLCMPLVISFSSFLHAKKVVPLPEVLKPGMIAVNDSRLFVAEKPKVHVYSLEDFKLVKTFGKSGEGPREFKFSQFGPPMIFYPYQKRLLVNSLNKISYFSQNGEFIKETKTTGFTTYIPMKDGYTGTIMTQNKKNKMVLGVSVFDSKLKKGKELYISDITVGPGATILVPLASFTFDTTDDKVFVIIGTEGFVIDVFDLSGNKLYRIKKDYPSIPVTDAYKKRTIHWFKNESPFKRFIGPNFPINFRDNYPPLKDIEVDNNKIYAITNKEIDGKREIVVMDLKGTELKRVSLEFPEEGPYFPSGNYAIRNDTLYTIVENEDDEQWELHIQEIK